MGFSRAEGTQQVMARARSQRASESGRSIDASGGQQSSANYARTLKEEAASVFRAIRRRHNR